MAPMVKWFSQRRQRVPFRFYQRTDTSELIYAYAFPCDFMNRREILTSLGAVASAGLSGCSTVDRSEGSGEPDDRASSPNTPTATLTPRPTVTETPSSSSTGPVRLTAADGEPEDGFGLSVAVSEDTALVGAVGYADDNGRNAGTVYVFERAGGEWSQRARLAPADGDDGDQFGSSVALDDDTALVVAWRDEHPNGFAAGSAYIFERAGGDWTQQAKLAPVDGEPREQFGSSATLNDGTALVGVRYDDGSAGSAYVFERSGSSWSQQAKLTADDRDSGDYFGEVVSLSGDTALVGAVQDEDPNGHSAGSAYVFDRAGGQWSQRAKLVSDSGGSGDFLGRGVALAGRTALVGSPGPGASRESQTGAVYVFEDSGGSWTQKGKLIPSNGDSEDAFGGRIATAADTALVSAVGDEDPNGTEAGSAYIFGRSSGTWSQQAKLVAPEGEPEDSFGWSLAMSEDGSTALVSAPGDRNPNGERVGSVYVFDF